MIIVEGDFTIVIDRIRNGTKHLRVHPILRELIFFFIFYHGTCSTCLLEGE